jgi:putative FmdB family regulatory protein
VPLFDYRCEKGHAVEVLLRSGEKGPRTCEVCGGGMKRQVGAPAAPKVRGGKRRRDIKFRRKGEAINLTRKGHT